jgi:hypothetical protein
MPGLGCAAALDFATTCCAAATPPAAFCDKGQITIMCQNVLKSRLITP